MRYVVRLLLGAILGALGLAALAWFGTRWWIAGASGALLSAIGFLGTFFVWSADRPDEGYEQVLFDAKNNVVTLSLVVLLVGAAFGQTYLHHEAPVVAAPASASLNGAHDNLTVIYNAIQAGKYDAPSAANATAQLADIEAVIAAEPSAKADLLSQAAKAIGTALGEYTTCKDKASCTLAGQLSKADALPAKKPLDAYATA